MMPLAPGYSYSIVEVAGGTLTTLTQTATGKTKVFSAAATPCTTNLAKHMASLTEDQCTQWFQSGQRKSKSKG